MHVISRSTRLIATPAALIALGLSATTLVSATVGFGQHSPTPSGFTVRAQAAEPIDERILLDPPEQSADMAGGVAAADAPDSTTREYTTVASTGGFTVKKASLTTENIETGRKERSDEATAGGEQKKKPKKAARPPIPQSFGEWLISDSRILIDQSQRLLYFKRKNGTVDSALIAVGRDGYFTPTGQFEVQELRHNPTWYPTSSMKREAIRNGERLPDAVPPGPHNPLGVYFIRFQPEYGIHGTNEPNSIGQAISRGCVRMLNEDVMRLASAVSVGDGVTIVRQFPQTYFPPPRDEVLEQPMQSPDYFYEPYVDNDYDYTDPRLAPLYTMPASYGG